MLGFVLLFTDLTEVKGGGSCATAFQNGLVESYAMKHARLDTGSDLVWRLLSSIVENAQIAALEIAESEHVAGIPSMLDSVRDSVARSAEVLETLVSHAMRSTAANVESERRTRSGGKPARKAWHSFETEILNSNAPSLRTAPVPDPSTRGERLFEGAAIEDEKGFIASMAEKS